MKGERVMKPKDVQVTILRILLEDKRNGGNGYMEVDELIIYLQTRLGTPITPNDLQYHVQKLGSEGCLEFRQEDHRVGAIILTTAGEAIARDDYMSPQPAVQYNNTFNMAGSYIGVFNQGTIEDLRINIGSLRAKGMEPLGKSLERMVAAISATNQLTQDVQRATVDNLAILTEELLKPEPKRRLEAVRIIILSTIPMLIGHVADLVGLWESDLMQQLLTAFGLS